MPTVKNKRCRKAKEAAYHDLDKRKAPPVHAKECKGQIRKGNDGRMWKSKRYTFKGKYIYRWVKEKDKKQKPSPRHAYEQKRKKQRKEFLGTVAKLDMKGKLCQFDKDCSGGDKCKHVNRTTGFGQCRPDGKKQKKIVKRKAPSSKTVPDRPKRSMSAFLFYSQKHRDGIRRKNPSMHITDVAKQLGRTWKTLSASKRKEFEQQAEKDKQRYEREKAAFIRKHGVDAMKKKKTSQKRRRQKTDGPKRAKNAFLFFSQQHRLAMVKKHPSKPITYVASALGKMWRNLSDSKKKRFQDLAAKDKLRYHNEKKRNMATR